MTHLPFVGLLLIGSLLIAGPVRAQDEDFTSSVNQVTVDMLRETVQFLATDTLNFKRVQETRCADCRSESQVLAFIRANGLTNAGTLVMKVQAKKQELLRGQKRPLSAEAAGQVAQQLRQYIISEVTKGGRAHRLALASYEPYSHQLDKLSQEVAYASDALRAVDTILTGAEVPSVRQQAAALQTPEADPALPEPTDEPVGSKSGLPTYAWVSMLVSGLTLLLTLYLFWRSRRHGMVLPAVDTGLDPAKASPGDAAKQKLARLTQRVAVLEAERTDLLNRLHRLEQTTRQTTTGRSRSVIDTAVTTAPARTPSPGSHAVPLEPTPAPAPGPMVPQRSTFALLYGRTADLGDGFSTSGLSEAPDRDTVFEIFRQGDELATFRISERPDLQQLALSDPFSYLNDTCIYQTQPRPGSRIHTDEPGRLHLQGDKWVITEKAQISFY